MLVEGLTLRGLLLGDPVVKRRHLLDVLLLGGILLLGREVDLLLHAVGGEGALVLEGYRGDLVLLSLRPSGSGTLLITPSQRDFPALQHCLNCDYKGATKKSVFQEKRPYRVSQNAAFCHFLSLPPALFYFFNLSRRSDRNPLSGQLS